MTPNSKLREAARAHLVLEPPSGHTCTDSQKFARAVLILEEALEKIARTNGMYWDVIENANAAISKAEKEFE